MARRPPDLPLGVAGRGETTTGQSVQGLVSGPPFDTLGMAGTYTSLFRRQANGVAVRAYRIAIPSGSAPVDPACAGPAASWRPSFPRRPLSGCSSPPDTAEAPLEGTGLVVLAAGSFGVAEGAAATSAVVRTGPGIATVRLTTPPGSDTMAPRDVMTVLAVGGLTDDGKLEGLGPNGEVDRLTEQPRPSRPKHPQRGGGPGGTEVSSRRRILNRQLRRDGRVDHESAESL